MPKLLRLDQVEEGQVQWLWYPYIPFGAATLLFGPGGVGKSHIICDLAARITKGRAFPHTQQRPEIGNVLIMSAEDDPGEVLKPRLRFAQADMRKVFCPDEEFTLDKKGFNLMKDFMSEAEATVIFIDPIVSYMGGKIDMFRANEVRTGTMQPLNHIARETGTALIAVGHERKNKGGATQDNAMGSADFVNAARSTLYAVEDKLGTAMFHVKSNYAPKGAAISYSFGSDGEEGDDVLEWGELRDDPLPVWGSGGKSHFTDDEGDSDMGGAKAKSEAFLLAILKDGPVPAKEVELRVKDEGLNMRTINRAKKEIGVESVAKRSDGKLIWYWQLKGQGRI